MQLESKRNIAKYILAFGGVQGLNIAIGLVRTKCIAVLLGPNGMGIMSLYNSAIQMMQNITNLGLDKSGVPMVSKAFEDSKQPDNQATDKPNDLTNKQSDNLTAKQLNDAIKQVRSLFLLASLLAMVCGILFSWLLSVTAFGDMSRTIHFIALSPVAALLTMASGEVLVLKAAHRLKTVALLSLLNIIVALIIAVPMFYVWGASAIIPSLVLTSLLQVLITMGYSYQYYPLHISLGKETIRKGMPVIRLGAAFLIASSMTSIAEFLIRSYLNNAGKDYTVGLYNVGCLIALTYGSMVFASIDSEYFPRLCKIDYNDHKMLNATIRRQIRMALSFVIPMVIILELLLPWIIPLLFSSKFITAVPMTQVALLALPFRAIYLPIGYVPLSRNDSRTYLLMDSIGAVVLVMSVMIGYHYGGLVGAGIGLVASNAFDMFNYILICHKRYGIKIL